MDLEIKNYPTWIKHPPLNHYIKLPDVQEFKDENKAELAATLEVFFENSINGGPNLTTLNFELSEEYYDFAKLCAERLEKRKQQWRAEFELYKSAYDIALISDYQKLTFLKNKTATQDGARPL